MNKNLYEMEKVRYVQFPLFLLNELIVDKFKAINLIIKYGIYRYSKKFSYQKSEVAKQLIYDNYRGIVSSELAMQIIELNSDIIGQSGYDCFNGKGELDADDEIQIIEDAFNSNEDLYNNAIEHYQIHMAYQSLNLKGDKLQCLKVAKDIELNIKDNEPMPMVSVNLLLTFRDDDKSEYELIQFVGYIAINSILGKRITVKTNKAHIVCRMFGYSSVKHLPEKLPKSIAELYNRYTKRYHIDKLLTNLELNWKLRTYSNNIRGLYVASASKIDINQLALIVETNKQKSKIKLLQQTKKDATKKALEQIASQQI
jgi:hypothetical protein